MRRIASILIGLFLCGSAWAGVTITLTKVSDTKVAIGYNATTELQLVRAFALDVTVTGGTIVGIADYKVGDDNHGYGIFPANFSRYITVNPTTGEVESWDDPNYTLVAPPDTPGALGGLGTNGITIEMGSLYDANAPAKTGVLCTVTVTVRLDPALIGPTHVGVTVVVNVVLPTEIVNVSLAFPVLVNVSV